MTQEQNRTVLLKQLNSYISENKTEEQKDLLIESLFEMFCLAVVKNNLQFNGHSSDLTKFIDTLKNGQTYQEIKAEQIKKYKYEYQRPLEYIKRKFKEKMENMLSFIQIVSEKMDEQQAWDFQEKTVSQFFKDFINYDKCEKCGNVLMSEGKCQLNIEVINSVEIDVPTGVLLVSDWFRDEKNVLSDLVEVKNTKIGKQLMKINDYEAQYGTTRLNEYAQVLAGAEKNVATVFVGNTCPSIYSNKGTVVVTDQKKKGKLDLQGSVCTDLWRTTIVDKQILEQYMKDAYSDEEVSDLWEELMGEAVEVSVTPGKYRLTHSVDKGYVNDEKYGNVYLKLELIK